MQGPRARRLWRQPAPSARHARQPQLVRVTARMEAPTRLWLGPADQVIPKLVSCANSLPVPKHTLTFIQGQRDRAGMSLMELRHS